MPRKFLKRILPDHKRLRKYSYLQKFGQRLIEPKLWHLNRKLVSGGVALGLFIGFMPIIGQMFLAAALAIVFRVNLPVAVFSSWLSNPLTFAPIFIFSYKLGAWLLQVPIEHHSFNVSWQWLSHEFLLIWQPLLLGSFVCGIVVAGLGMLFSRLLWRIMVLRNWSKRQGSKANKNK